MSLRDYFPSDRDVRKSVERSERTGFRLAARGFFLVLLFGLIGITVAAEMVLVAVLASVAVGIMLRSALPAARFETWIRGYWTGAAGDRWRRRFDRWQTKIRRFL